MYMELSVLEQKYVSTCYPLPDRPFLAEAMHWKEVYRRASAQNEVLRVPLRDVARAFPHFGRMYYQGLFNKMSVQEYFESITQDSHTMRNYLFAKNVAKNNPPEDILRSVLHHITGCSVRVARTTDSMIWSFGGTYEAKLDLLYFGEQEYGEYVFVHGMSENGAIVIADAPEDKFRTLKEWYEARQAKSKNPFNKYGPLLEEPFHATSHI